MALAGCAPQENQLPGSRKDHQVRKESQSNHDTARDQAMFGWF